MELQHATRSNMTATEVTLIMAKDKKGKKTTDEKKKKPKK